MRTDPVIPTAEPRKPSTFSLEAPSGSEDGPTDYTAIELTVTSLRAVLRGSTSPSVTWTVRFASVRNAVGTEVVVGGTTTTSVTTGDTVTTLTNPVIPADSFIWIETTVQSGVVLDLTISVVYA